jgi:hypothetical protein
MSVGNFHAAWKGKQGGTPKSAWGVATLALAIA